MKNEEFHSVTLFKIFALILPLLLQVGCAGSQFKQATDAEARKQIDSITSIAVLEIPEPLQYKFGQGLLGPGMAFFGLIGGIAEMAAFTNADSTSEYTDDFKFSEQMQNNLVTSLQNKNIDVSTISVIRNENRQLLDSYNGFPTNVDAYLDVVPGAYTGYMRDSGMFDPDYDPVLTASVRLVSAKTKEVLFEDQFFYGGESNPFLAQIEAPEEHVYDTLEELKNNKKEAIERLIIGVGVLGSNIVQNVSPNRYVQKISSSNPKAKTPSTEAIPTADIAATDKLDPDSNISGTYISEITSTSSKALPKWFRNLEIALEQRGKNITGTDKSGKVELHGTLEGDTIKFHMLPNEIIGYNDSTGNWKFSTDGKSAGGTWKVEGGRQTSRDWNLTKIK